MKTHPSFENPNEAPDKSLQATKRPQHVLKTIQQCEIKMPVFF